MEKSTHKVEVVQVYLDPHPNADTLSVVKVFGYTVCVRTADWNTRSLGAYIPPDSIVDTTRPEFAFLHDHKRIRVKRLRGIVSMGLLIPAPEGSVLGDDVADLLNVTHYEPPLSLSTGGEDCRPPQGYHPNYDLDSLYRYVEVFEPDEPVWVTEKIHGANGRFCCIEGEMFVGSRTAWKRKDDISIWWRALNAHPEVEEFCRCHLNCTVYGEVYGRVQSLHYGTKPGEVRIAVFDILRGSEWVNPVEALSELGPMLPWVPPVPLAATLIHFDFEQLITLADGPSLVSGADHIREGIVVKPIKERTHPEIGRVCLKLVSNQYLGESDKG